MTVNTGLLGLALLLAGCVDYGKLSAGSPDLALAETRDGDVNIEQPKRAKLGEEVDGASFFVEEDMASATADAASPADGAIAPADMTQISTDMAKPCTTTLTGAGQGDFQIRFRLNTTVFMNAGIMSQRSVCGFPVNGFWDTRLIQVSGQMKFEIGSGGGGTTITTPGAVNDGPHDITITRTNFMVSIYVDNVFQVAATSTATIGTLPNLAYYSPCDSLNAPTVTNVCITK